MKKIYLATLLILAIAMTGHSQITWDNFEDSRKATYGFISGTFIPYSQNLFPNGVNFSEVSATYTRNPAEAFDVIVMEGVMADLTDYVNGTKQMTINVYSPAPNITVQITLENAAAALPDNFPTGRHSIYLAQTTVANAWEPLTFTFDQQPDASIPNTSVDQLVLLFAPGTNTDDTYFFDNLRGPELANDPCEDVQEDVSVLNDFECQQNVNYIFSHSGINFRRVVNPGPDETNGSDFVATYTRNGGEVDDVLIGRFDGNLDLGPTSVITLDVWGDAGPKPLTLSLQTVDDDVIEAYPSFIAGEGSWETVSFNVGSQSENPDIGQFVILFDPGTNNSDVYFFDNMTVSGVVSTEEEVLIKNIVAFPNPATDAFTIEYSLIENSDVNITLTDITGRVIENISVANQAVGKQYIEFDTADFSDGIYLFNVQVDGKNNTGKIIVAN